VNCTPPPSETVYKKNEFLSTREIYEQANAQRKWDKKNRHYQIAKGGAYYFRDNNGRKCPKEFVEGELKRKISLGLKR